MKYKTAIMPLDIISERLKYWRAQSNVREVRGYINGERGWLEIFFFKKETPAQRNARLMRELDFSNSAVSQHIRKIRIDQILQSMPNYYKKDSK